jgi:hypothetical protein
LKDVDVNETSFFQISSYDTEKREEKVVGKREEEGGRRENG